MFDKYHSSQKFFILIAVIFVGLCTSLYYILYIYEHLGFSSDSTVRMLYAREALETNSYFPLEWNFVNKDFWNLDQTLIARVLLTYLPVSYLVNAIVNIVSLFIFYVCAIVFIKNITSEFISQLQALALVSTGISFPIAYQLFGEMAYGFFTVYLFIILSATWTLLTTKNLRLRRFSFAALIMLITVLASMNPFRVIVYLVVPLLMTLGAFHVYCGDKTRKESENKEWMCLSIALIIAVAVGYLLHYILSQLMQPPTGYGTVLSLTDFKNYPKKFLSIASGFVSLVGGEPQFGLSRKSLAGLYQEVRLITGILFLILIIIQIIRGFKSRNNAFIFMALFSLSSLFILCAIRVGLNELQSDRYFIPPFVVLLIALATLPLPTIKIRPFRLVLIGVVLMQFSTSVAICTREIWQQYDKNAARSVGYPLYKNLDQIIDHLMDKKLSYGYATYWRAGLITALSQERVKLRQIDIDNGIVAPAKWHSSNRWYDENYYTGPSFLLLTPEEYQSIDWDKMSALGMTPVGIEKRFDYVVLSYGVNIARFWQKNK